MNEQQTNKKLVVVDDDLAIQELLTAYFRPKGYDVTVFSDAETALVESKNKNLKWDILICDLQLPQMSGLQFMDSIRKIRPELPIIFVTGTHSVETAVQAIENGAYDFIVKPIHLAQLKISVERALHISGLNENITELRQHIKTKETKQSDFIIGRSPQLLAALDVAKKVAKSNANIFISGESGSGKEVFARYIHAESNRANGAFIAINCSAIPENLLESELFGHAKGSFTGAADKKVGLFEAAENGTLFLDEIGDLSPSLQAKLLRVLQEKKIRRVGENELRPINCRIISATHKNLANEIIEGRFREDLFFRLNVIPINIPSLRARPEDILPLAESFLRKYTLINGSPAKVFSKEAVKYLLENPWPGNVRELENAVERAVVMCAGTAIQLGDFLLSSTPDSLPAQALARAESLSHMTDAFTMKVDKSLPDLQEVVQKYIEFAVQRNGGAKDKTAKEIGIDRKTLYRKMKSAEHYMQ